ncbi:hypothetical protein PHYPSEUDO_009022 [Phytophthora pseudosyringae]|uniref:Ubiquitin-like domain-containing protein n=1 Tax=Phytophthora pseudosyringae TaxID=221518 RepID=A0A8T1VI83_9STRA|nr:hypothetical protein PHYPSEUDO_009022 [Phytophthora pseudosyringae]
MSDKSELLVTVVFGKLSTPVRVSTRDPQALEAIKTQICERFQLAPAFQRLVLRGRDVKSATALTDGCKLLLLRNRAYHEQATASKPVQTSASSSLDESSPPAKNSGGKPSCKTPEIDVNELEDDALLVQVFRGKARYDVIFPRSGTVLEVKRKVSAVLGLSSPQALRLVVKGKTPKDETRLEALAGSKKTIKAMALLQAQQHVMQEKEEDLRELLNELARAQAALQRVQRQMARNFTSRDESLFELSRVLDEGQHVAGNLELVQQHLAGAKATGPRASEQTLVAVAQAIEEANAMTEAVQGLLETHSSF